MQIIWKHFLNAAELLSKKTILGRFFQGWIFLIGVVLDLGSKYIYMCIFPSGKFPLIYIVLNGGGGWDHVSTNHRWWRSKSSLVQWFMAWWYLEAVSKFSCRTSLQKSLLSFIETLFLDWNKPTKRNYGQWLRPQPRRRKSLKLESTL